MTSSNGHPAHQQSPASSSTTTTAASSSSQTPSAPPPVVSPSAPLADRFPVNSLQHLTLQSGEAISGRVYCTDETTKSLVLQTDLVHTTLAAEIRIIAVDSILSHQQQNATATTASFSTSGESDETSLFLPLPKINKKTLEDRERRAMRMAEDSLRHINQKASPLGQAMFDRLLKACGQVIWKDDTTSILVLNQIQVNAPYGPENCEIIIGGGGGMSNGVATATTKSGSGTATSSSGSSSGNGVLLEDGSLERVRKIVAAVNADLAEANNMEQSG